MWKTKGSKVFKIVAGRPVYLTIHDKKEGLEDLDWTTESPAAEVTA